MKKPLIILFIIALSAGAAIFLYTKEPSEKNREAKIKVFSPAPHEFIESPLQITGEARGTWFFEASFPVKLIDAEGNLLALGIAEAESEWTTENFVPFVSTLEFNPGAATSGFLVLEKDNPSGLPENADEMRMPINISHENTTAVEVFFGNSQKDPEAFDCSNVFPATRTIYKTKTMAKAALDELLKGPTFSEKEQGFFSSINPGVAIQKLTIENGLAKADFTDVLEFQVGGSCRVAAIRSQITKTLKRFPSVKEVLISINGRTEDILQP